MSLYDRPYYMSWTGSFDRHRPSPGQSLSQLGEALTRPLLATILAACMEQARKDPKVTGWLLEDAQGYIDRSQAAATLGDALTWAFPVFKKCQMAVGAHFPSARDASDREAAERTEQIQLIARLVHAK